MYRLMVVEDEAMIRRGIIKSIPWGDLGFVVVGEGKNGEEALAFMAEHPVDVLLTDIKMPLMDGIELSKKVRRLYPDIEIVVLSGFSDFEYARAAISFRAYEYLLKPTNKQRLLDAFTNLKRRMDEKSERKEEIFHSNIYLTAGYESVRREFLIGLLEGDQSLYKDFDEKAAELELDFSTNQCVSAVIRFDKKSIMEELACSWETDKRLLRFAYDNIIREALGDMERAYFVVEDYDTIHLIYCFDTLAEKEASLIPSLENISENIQNCLFKHVVVPYTIGIGLTYPSVYHITKSHNQAKRSIQNSFYQSSECVQVYQDNEESKFEQNYIQYYPEDMQRAAGYIVGGQKDEARVSMDKMFQRLIDNRLMPEIVKNYCITLKLMVQSKLKDESDLVNRVIGNMYSDYVKDALTVRELHQYVRKTMLQLSEEINRTVDVKAATEQRLVIAKAKDYIKEHLNDKINLKVISNHVYLSETYFSYLFKKVTGTTYIDYIQRLRMEEAKHLLITTNDKIYEIAEQIGYNDYKYFAIQFKKYVKVTPKAYRNQGRQEVIG